MFRKLVASILLFLFVFATSANFAEPSATNRIGLRFPRVYLAKEQVFDLTTEAGTNKYEYTAQPLKLDDEIRYAWFGTNLNIANVSAPVAGNGYLKIYKNDDSSEANLIRTYGSSPLPIRDVAQKLTPGRNTLLFVLVENAQGSSDPATKVQVSFDFAPDVLPASIEVLSPTPGSVFASGITRDFSVKLNNFFLEKENSNTLNKGYLELYANEVKPENLLNTFKSSIARDTFSEVSFTSNDLEKLQEVSDSPKTQLIFVLKNSNGQEIANTRKNLEVATNYGGSVDLGLPSIVVKSPANNSEITPATKIQLEVKNFNLLAGLDTTSQKSNTGYIQVRINDKLVVENTNKTEFSLADYGLTNFNGVITIRFDLVDQQFAFLQPAAQAGISLVVKKDTSSSSGEGIQVTSSTWRYVVLAATILLILGSIIVLVIKG